MSLAFDKELSTSLGPRLAPGAIRSFYGPLLLMLAYYLGAEAAFLIGTLSDKIFALFWPPNVILFCGLLLVPQRKWPVYITAAFVAHVAAETRVGMPATQLLVAFLTNCMVACLNAYFIRRLIGGPPWLGTLRATILYILITVGVSPVLSAFGGAVVPIMGGGTTSDYWVFWGHWYLANVLPNLTLGPVFLIWFADYARGSNQSVGRDLIHAVIITMLLVAAAVAAAELSVFLTSNGLRAAILFTPLPLVLWAAVRYGAKGASVAILIVAVILTARTLRGPGLFSNEDPAQSVLALQLFLLCLSVPILLLGVIIDEFRRTEVALRRATASVLQVRDEERRRIARELHDTTGQNLIAGILLTKRIQAVPPAAIMPLIVQLASILQQSLREVRTVSYLLHPPLLDDLGLELALRDYVDGYSKRSGITVTLVLPEDFERLPPEIELVLFRVIQEALTNVARHSNSPTATISLKRTQNARGKIVELIIEDSALLKFQPIGDSLFAAGSNIERYKYGVGLTSMRERLTQIGGGFGIQQESGRTRIVATIPLKPDREDSRSRLGSSPAAEHQ